MDIEKHLKQLSTIQPDPHYARVSKLRILAAARPKLPQLTFGTFVLGILRSGSAMAVTGLLLFFTIGGFSVYKLIGPLTGLDNSLYAEAQAIDIQIHLAALQYEEIVSGRQALIAPNDRNDNFRSGSQAVLPANGDDPKSDEGAGADGDAVPDAGDEGEAEEPTESEGSEGEAGEGREDAPAEGEEPAEPPVEIDVERALDILSR